MTPYDKLKTHLEEHLFKRGRNWGHAPADPDRRSRDHVLVMRNGENMCVRMYSTDILTVTPQNKITISMGGWWGTTTKQNLNDALARFLGWGSVYSQSLFSYSQMAITVRGKTYKFYDGMEFDAAGTLLSPRQFFERRRTSKEATAEFRKDIEESGFKAVWPVLFATAEPHRGGWRSKPIAQLVTQECYSNEWAMLAAQYKAGFDDHKQAYAALVRECTRSMTEIVKTDVSELV